MAQWLALLPLSKKVLGSIPSVGLPEWSFHVLPVSAWVSSGHSGFLPHPKHALLPLHLTKAMALEQELVPIKILPTCQV